MKNANRRIFKLSISGLASELNTLGIYSESPVRPAKTQKPRSKSYQSYYFSTQSKKPQRLIDLITVKRIKAPHYFTKPAEEIKETHVSVQTPAKFTQIRLAEKASALVHPAFKLKRRSLNIRS